MTIDRNRRTSFDTIARLYDLARPGYPEALIEDVSFLSGIPPTGRILEIGCGTGKATVPFARRGYAMLCLSWARTWLLLPERTAAPKPQPHKSWLPKPSAKPPRWHYCSNVRETNNLHITS